ncbi:MAG: hypothetical protein Q8K20_06075 [Gemmobacter sp.]|nr:hypothetical protein [Gemmobacter sp.]
MTDMPFQIRPAPELSATARGSLPDAPLAMPTQRLEAEAGRGLAWLMAPWRLLRLPLSRGV